MWQAIITGALAAAVVVLATAAAIFALRLRGTRHRLEAAQLHNRQLAAQLATQEALSAGFEPIKAIGEAAYNVLFLVDERRSILYVNAAGRDLFGLEEKDGRYGSLISITHNHEIEDIVIHALEEGDDLVWQITLRACVYRVRTLLIDRPAGKYVAVALEDVSELQRLGRARRDMVANISHELRTPITSIRLLVDTLLRGTLDDPEACRVAVHKIAAETDHLRQMAQELLDLAMIESGRAEVILVPVTVGEIVAGAVGHLAEHAQRKRLTIQQDIPGDLVALADPEQITRVLSNLLHNAIKFTPSRGTITLSAVADGSEIKIAVMDTGPGISPEERQRIFERFYRGDRARRGEGTGLGLAIAKHIVNAHGGAIWAEESPHPPGARICFTIPAA